MKEDATPTAVPERAVVLDAGGIEMLMELRRQRGLDERDEMWEGVLHMVPPPNDGHSGSQTALTGFLIPIARRLGGRMRIGLGIREAGSGERNYRVPDLAYLAPEDFPKQGEIYCDGGPAVVFEVLSPRDESYEKLDFYARVGVREVVMVSPRTARVEIFRLAGGRYVAAAADSEGRIPLVAMGIRFQHRTVDDRPALFALDDATGAEERIA